VRGRRTLFELGVAEKGGRASPLARGCVFCVYYRLSRIKLLSTEVVGCLRLCLLGRTRHAPPRSVEVDRPRCLMMTSRFREGGRGGTLLREGGEGPPPQGCRVKKLAPASEGAAFLFPRPECTHTLNSALVCYRFDQIGTREINHSVIGLSASQTITHNANR